MFLNIKKKTVRLRQRSAKRQRNSVFFGGMTGTDLLAISGLVAIPTSRIPFANVKSMAIASMIFFFAIANRFYRRNCPTEVR